MWVPLSRMWGCNSAAQPSPARPPAPEQQAARAVFPPRPFLPPVIAASDQRKPIIKEVPGNTGVSSGEPGLPQTLRTAEGETCRPRRGAGAWSAVDSEAERCCRSSSRTEMTRMHFVGPPCTEWSQPPESQPWRETPDTSIYF